MSFQEIFSCFAEEPSATVTIEISEDGQRWIDIDASDIALHYEDDEYGGSVVILDLDELPRKSEIMRGNLTLLPGGKK